MCIFSRPVLSVNNTQIFARASGRGTQYLVYQLNYESQNENAMILPVPVRQPVREDSLRFIDLQDYADFFSDLARGFPYSKSPLDISCSASPESKTTTLEVFKVGNYIASFVPGLADFERLDAQFRLPEEAWARLPQYRQFGFAVFQLAAGSLQPHPMAFEFESAGRSLFFPTVHIHDGEVHETEEFDHVLYLQHAGFDSRVYAYQNSHVADRSTGLIRSKEVANQFCNVTKLKGVVDGQLLVHRRIVRGAQPNQDVEIATVGDPTRRTLNLRPYFSYAPWLAIATMMATWFLVRRTRRKAEIDAGREASR